MDYLDPNKQFRNTVLLLTGYVLIAIAIVIATIILLYQANGFGLGKNGTVIQNGLVFFSSQPNPAQIYLNGKPNKQQTNTRQVLPAGFYKVKISRTGYRDWQRTIEVDGGSVVHYDYPLLFPTKLTTKVFQAYAANPELASQSPDRRWLLVNHADNITNFDLYDLKTPTKNLTTISLPATLLTKSSTGSEHWELVKWADDNQHVLLKHVYDATSEYILVDRDSPDQSVNVTQTLGVNPPQLSFNNGKYDQYYLYDPTSQILQTASLKAVTPVNLLSHVLAFKTYADSSVLYMTDNSAATDTTNKVALHLLDLHSNQDYQLHSFPSSSNYLLDLTEYSGTPYVVASSTDDNKVYIYKDPINQLHNQPNHAVTPIQVLHVTQPNYIKFSSNAQFVLAEHGNQFAVYDIENKNSYSYTTKAAIDSPQTNANWMDGDRLTYVSGGNLQVFDYDNRNQQSLVAAEPTSLPFFSSNYSLLYSLAPVAKSTTGAVNLTQTSLLTP